MAAFVFGKFSYSGLGDATWFAASCIDQPGKLIAPSPKGKPIWPNVVNFTVVDPFDSSEGDVLPEPNECGIATLSDISSLLGSYAFCEGSTDLNGEVLICNRPLSPLVVSCNNKPLMARVSSAVSQTLKVEHYPSLPEFAFNALRGSYSQFGPSTTPPSGFHSFEGGCEIFTGRDITCFGGNGIFVALPFGHQCSGSLENPTQLVCSNDGNPLECSAENVGTDTTQGNEEPTVENEASTTSNTLVSFALSLKVAVVISWAVFRVLF
uniref:Uncharacterized protein n=1 Tax=Ditylum brightwellii TaxID=49249 RepID=A0A7S4QZX7_9STRA